MASNQPSVMRWRTVVMRSDTQRSLEAMVASKWLYGRMTRIGVSPQVGDLA